MAIQRPDTPLAATPEANFSIVNDSIKPRAILDLKQRRDSIKGEQRKVIWKKSYDTSEEKKKGDSFDQWYGKFDTKTKENAKKAPEPKGERTFFAGDNGPKSPCKGGKCSGLN